MPKKQNLDIVDAFSSKFEKASGVYFTDYLGLSVKDITELRSKFTSDGVEFCVVKNKLAQISFKNAGFEEIGDVLKGPTAIAFSYDDPTSPARILKEFKKNNELPVVKAFLVDGKMMDKTAFSAVANLPSREVLITKFVSGLSSPMSKFASTLRSSMGSLLNVLNNIKESKSN